MTLSEFVSEAIGAPFKPHGRGPEYDCWGIVCEAYRRVTGVELDDYGGEYGTLKDMDRLKRIFARECGTTWYKVEAPEPMDVAVIYRSGRAIHAGLYIGNGNILHIEHGVDAVIEPSDRFRIEGYYRPCA